MNKCALLILSLLAFAWQLNAQITVQSSHMPKANDTFRYVTGNPLDYSSQIALNGTNQTWVFPKATPAITSVVEYSSSSKTPYAFYFFNTIGLLVADSLGFSQFQMEDVYQFYSTNSNTYRIEGIGFKISLAPLPLAGNYQQEDKVFQFPLEYEDRDSNAFKVKVNIPLVGSYSQSGYRITEVLGYGKVVVVDDTLQCLKVRSEVVGADTIDTQLGKFGFPTRRIEYKWLTLEHRAPVAEIIGQEVAGQFVPSQAKYLNLPPKQTGNPTSVANFTNSSMLLYPNPAGNRIMKAAEVEELQAYDMQGKQMAIFWDGNVGTLDWPMGVYSVLIRKTDGTQENLRLAISR